ncbi:MAG TPA: DNA methyltransferase, partial [Phycisphaerae bacterium]|nr:DNA methyltransferase [Phycisphaerae bacterium]
MQREIKPAQFIRKWSRTALPERAASQEHFIDLCCLLGQATPAEQDATGEEYTFEKGVTVTDVASRGSKGRHGFADVWWRGKFAWEYKRKDKYKDLTEAYRQLCQYREALENPPLLIVSDIARTEIHTNFTGTRKEVHVIKLEHLAHPDNLDKLRRVFSDPHSFKPALSTYRLTENAAAEFAKIADALRQRGHDAHAAAHFLMKCMFCLFAEDVTLLPKGLFSKLLQAARSDPDSLTERLTGLFDAMRAGGFFGAETIAHFNGGLFDEAPALPLRAYDMHNMLIAGEFDWAAVEPTIFGTLFERSLDPSKRSQIGAHYTSREDIMLIVEPVVMQPLRREWGQVRERVEKQLARRGKSRSDAAKKKTNQRIAELLQGFQHRLATVRVLDPACGSGNFLYVAIQELLSLEKEVIVYASRPEIALGLIPQVRPTQLHGIEINPFAAELAQVVIWIGYLQWMKQNGFLPPSDPILAPLQTIECRDAILAWEDGDGNALSEWREGANCRGPADWPPADFIIGNPPFLGSKLFREYGLPDPYIEAMYTNFDLPNTSDLCCYWFELARRHVAQPPPAAEKPHPRAGVLQTPRVGLLATQGIRGGDNRRVLERIKETGDIFMAWSDREWILDGAAVHVSMVGFDSGDQQSRKLDGQLVSSINPNLTGGADTTAAQVLAENRGMAFMGDTKVGPFEIEL